MMYLDLIRTLIHNITSLQVYNLYLRLNKDFYYTCKELQDIIISRFIQESHDNTGTYHLIGNNLLHDWMYRWCESECIQLYWDLGKLTKIRRYDNSIMLALSHLSTTDRSIDVIHIIPYTGDAYWTSYEHPWYWTTVKQEKKRYLYNGIEIIIMDLSNKFLSKISITHNDFDSLYKYLQGLYLADFI